MPEPEEIWYTSFDGKKIQGWILKPPGFTPSTKYPLILEIHGGPHSAYGNTFTHEFQWMAAKGYVVLYTNPRGSSNYGQEFGNIIQFAYPGDDYKDLMAGVDEVVKRGYIDETRLGVTGGSGGGLLTNWVVTQTTRFKAAVSQRDISDWGNFWYTADFTLFTPTWFHKAPFEDPADFAKRSPITYVNRIQTPLMFILGDEDYRTPPGAGGEDLFRALKYLEAPDRDGALPWREPRALALGQALAPRRAPPAHRRLVRQMAVRRKAVELGDRLLTLIPTRPLFERHARSLCLQLVQQPHDVVGRQLDERARGFGVLFVAQHRLERLHRRHQPLLLTGKLLLRDDAVRECARERLELRDLFLNQRMLRLLVEPACAGHVHSFRLIL